MKLHRRNQLLVFVVLLVQFKDCTYNQIGKRTLQSSTNELQIRNLSGYINLLGPITNCRVRLFSDTEIYGADKNSDVNTGYYQFSVPARGKIRTVGSCFDEFILGARGSNIFSPEDDNGLEILLELQAETGMDPNIHNIVVSPISTLVSYLIQEDRENQLPSPDLVVYYKKVGQLLGLSSGGQFGNDFFDLIGFNYVAQSVKSDYLGIAVNSAVAAVWGTVSLGVQFLTNIKSQQSNTILFSDIQAAYKYMFLGLEFGTTQTELDFESQSQIKDILKYAFNRLQGDYVITRKLLQGDDVTFNDIQLQVQALSSSIATANQEYVRIRDGSLIIAKDQKSGKNTTQTQLNLGLQSPRIALQSIVQVTEIQQTTVKDAVKQLASGNYDIAKFSVQFGGDGLSSRFEANQQSNEKISDAFESFENEESEINYAEYFADAVREQMSVATIVAICCSAAGGVAGVVLGAVVFTRGQKVGPLE